MTYSQAVRQFKRDLLAAAIREHGTIAAAAVALHLNRTYAQKLCTELDVPRTRRNHANWGDEARA